LNKQAKIISSHIVHNNIGEVRFLDYAIENMPTILSRNSAKKAIKNGELTLDGKVVESGRFVKQGQVIEYLKSEAATNRIFKLDLPVVFEDNHIAVINKLAGLSVSGNYFKTLQNALPYNLMPSTATDALQIFRPAHRLDNQTSGVVIVAKTQSALINLSKQFEKKTIKKTYAAVVIGKPESRGIIDFDIEGKKAVSEYELLTTVNSIKYNSISLLKLSPLTGRTHQLRIHLSKIGHPVLGDRLYTSPELLFKGKGLFLSAVSVRFMHPEKNKLVEFAIETPHKFNALLNREQKRYDSAFSDKL